LKIARDRVFLEKKQGGLGLVPIKNFLTCQKCGWFKLVSKLDDHWKRIIFYNSYGNIFNARKCWYPNNIILSSFCESLEILSERFAKINENFKEAYIFDNFNFLSSKRPVKKLNSEFFDNDGLLDKSAYVNLKVNNFINNNVAKTPVQIQQETNLIFTQEKLNKILVACRDFCNRNAKPLPINQSCSTLNTFFNRVKKGSNLLRNVLNNKCKGNLPHNIIKYAETTNTVISSIEGEILNGLWGLNFLDNSLRTFCFKLHNNTLGYNYSVSKFVRNVSPICTFCTLTRNPEDERECPLHLFFQCRHVEPVIRHIYVWLLGQRDFDLMTRNNFFGGFKYDNFDKNWILDLLNLSLKKFIWDCKLRFVVPTNLMAENYIKIKIKEYHLVNKTFREKWEKANINIRF